MESKLQENKEAVSKEKDIQDVIAKLNLNDFVMHNKIGQGSFGKVYKVKSKKDNRIYAAKISINSIDDNEKKYQLDIAREVSIMSKINHPSILQFIFFSSHNFKNKNKPVIITEYASNGTLENVINGELKDKVNNTQKLIISYGIASGMSYLHSHDILHRDLKPENILIDDFLFPKISDFGLSKFSTSKEEETFYQSTIGNIKGTPIYMSPEIWKHSEYSQYSDVYAFSFILYQLFTNEKPFDNCNLFQIASMICQGYRPKFTKEISSAIKNLIERCWSEEPQKRPTFSEIVNELRNNSDFLSPEIDKDIFYKYIKYIDDYDTSFDQGERSFDINKVFLKMKLIKSKENQLNEIGFSKIVKNFPYNEFIKLDEECKKLVIKAEEENDNKLFFIIGQNLIECLSNFPLNRQLGIKYLELSFKEGNVDSLIYYIRILIKGKIIPKNHRKVRKLLDEKMDHEDPIYLFLCGLMYKYEQEYSLAKEFFLQSSSKGNSESKYELGKMYEKGIFFEKDINKSIEYYKESIKGGNNSALHKYGHLLINEGKQREGLHLIIQAAKNNHIKSVYDYTKLLFADKKKDESMCLFKKLADKGHIDSMLMYASQSIYHADIQEKKDEILKIYKKAADKGNILAIYSYGYLLSSFCNDCLDHKEEQAKYIRIAANNGIPDAMNSYGYFLYEGYGVPVNYEESKKYLQMAIEKGNSSAMNNYANMLEKGIGVQSNPKEAAKYYKMAINEGNDNAMCNYSFMLLKGDRNESNIQEAKKYFKMAIEKGNTIAMISYGNMYRDGIGFKANKEEAFKYYKMAIDHGSSDAMYQYASTISMDKEIENKEEAIKYYKEAIERGNTSAMINYGNLFYHGKDVTLNKEEALKYYKMAADNGDVEGMYWYSKLLYNGDGVLMNKEEAIKYLKMSAEKGFPRAMSDYAYLLLNGENVSLNKDEAIKYFKMAIEKNESSAMYYYATMLYNGDGIDVNKEEAAKYFKMAADNDFIDAIQVYGYMLDFGDGIEINKEEALKYYRKAADKGDLISMNNLAYLLFNGDGVAPNKEEAIKYYKLAADGGYGTSMFHYAEILHHGNGVDVDIEGAIKYYKKAIENGEERAKEGLKILTGEQ